MLTRHRWWALTAWAVLCAVAHTGRLGFGWHFFVAGAHHLASGNGLHLYADNRELQSGPLAFVAVLPLVKALPGHAGEAAAIGAMTLLGVLVLWLVERLCRLERADATGDDLGLRILIAGLPALAVWAEVATHWAHPDDVLALLTLVAGLWAARSGRWAWAALLFGLAVDAKPWALLFAPLLLLVPPRRWAAAAGVYLVTLAVAWLPFYLADARSVDAGRYAIPVSQASVLALFGASGGTPGWCRPAQLVLGLLVVLVAVRRDRWAAALLVGVCARMLLDPATKNYYESGLVVAAVIYDLLSGGRRWLPVTCAAVLLVWAPSYLLEDLPTARSVLRLAFLAGAPLAVLARPQVLTPMRRHLGWAFHVRAGD